MRIAQLPSPTGGTIKLKPIPRPPIVRNAIPSVHETAERLTSQRLRDIRSALQDYERSLTTSTESYAVRRLAAAATAGTAAGPKGAAAVIVFSELSGLLRTVVAHHPKGTVAKLSRALNTVVAGGTKPMVQLLGEMIEQAEDREARTTEETTQ